MGSTASQITSFSIVYSAVYSGTDERKHQSSASLAFVRAIHRWLVNSPHKAPETRQMFPFDDDIMLLVFSARYLVSLNQKSRDAMVQNGCHGHECRSNTIINIMTSWYCKAFHINGPFGGIQRWIPLTRASYADLWSLLCCRPEQAE